MSRKLFAFLLSELKTVRVLCPKCNAVTELTVEQMGFRFDDLQCRVCRHDLNGFTGPNGENRLSQLGRAIHAIQSLPGSTQVEFVLPDESDAKK